MEVRGGYKQTEVGTIPEEWDAKCLREFIRSDAPICYGILMPGQHCNGGVPVVKVRDIVGGRIDDSNLLLTHPSIDEAYKRSRLLPDDVLITIRGTTGRVAIVPTSLKGANITQDTARLRLKDKIYAVFLFYALQSEAAQRFVLLHTIGQAVKGINIRDVKNLPIAIPSPIEQGSIASALASVDALLNGLERLIAKKRDLKQATMQQLLTGQTRLPGFRGEWCVKTLGDVISHCFSGATPRRNRPEFYRGDIRWITSGELNYNVITDTIEKISKDAVAQTNLAIHPAGTFLMAITGLEAEGTRGACGIVGAPSATNQSCMAVFPTAELLTSYLFHYYVFRGKALALEYCQGTKQQSYTAGLVKKLPISLPPSTVEQAAIAAVLSDMDVELSALEARRNKTRNLKQAMMQELLTGRTRLV